MDSRLFLDTFSKRHDPFPIPMASVKPNKAKNDKPAAPAAKPAAPAPKPVVAAPAAKPVVAAKPSVTKPVAKREPSQEEIQIRAYEIYVSEGCREGNDLDNWARAERELRTGR
jgi:hypothetical protein